MKKQYKKSFACMPVAKGAINFPFACFKVLKLSKSGLLNKVGWSIQQSDNLGWW